MILDATKAQVQRRLLENELEAVGIRLNTSPPNIGFAIKSGGGLKFNAVVPLTHLNEKLVYAILHEYSIQTINPFKFADLNISFSIFRNFSCRSYRKM